MSAMLRLVTLVTVVTLVTARPDCLLPRLCKMVCGVSAPLAARCEICHPGICGGKEVKPLVRVVNLAPPAAKSTSASSGAAQKALDVPRALGDSDDNDDKAVYSVEEDSIDVDDQPTTSLPSDLKESDEYDSEDVSSEGSGADDEDEEPALTEAAFDGRSPESSSPDEADPAQTEPEEKEPEQAEPEEPESSEPAGGEHKVAETKPEETSAEIPEPEDTDLEEPLSREPEPEEPGTEELRPDKAQTETKELASHPKAEEDDSEEDVADGSQSQKPAKIPVSSEYLPKKPKKNEADQPKDEPEEADPEDSEDTVASSAAPRFFSRTDSRSGLACLHSGTYHPLHSSWFDTDHCNLHVCTTGGVATTSLTGACKPPPANMTQCNRYRLPGQCCFSYDCADGGDGPLRSCIDAFGVERPHNAHWVDDEDHPCVRFFCADGIAVVLSDMRPLCPVPPSHGCTAFQPEGMCCNDFNCTEAPMPLACLDAQGNRRDNGQIWYDNDVIPCRKFLCNNGTIELLEDLSESCLQSTGPGCVPVPVSGHCCPTFSNCSCHYNGAVYLSGANFPDDPTFPCRRLLCDNGTITTLEERQCRTLNCSPKFRRPGECCYECVGCVHDGVRRPEGSLWYDDPQRPCVRFTCSNSRVVEVNRTECPESPGPHCQAVLMPGDCCPMFDCSGVTCPYGDQIYHEGDVWVDDPVFPCKWFTCRRTGVQQVNNTYCPPLVPRDCPTQREPGQCCHSCQTVAPVSCYFKGQTYLEGDVWVDDPVFPCKWFTCRRTGVQQVNNTYCPPLVPPDCPTQREPGQCCHRCQTTDDDDVCMDESGVIRESGDIYYTDPGRCILARCVREREELVLNRTELCPAPPPSSNCSVIGLVNCCPQYLCHLMPISNCTDSTGRRRNDGEIYATDEEGCLLVQCEKGSESLLVDRSTLCPPVAFDLDVCIQTGIEDCCPVIECPGPANCVDSSGTHHSEGDMYYEDPSRCLLVECSDGEEVIIMDKTQQCDPPPENPNCAFRETLDCCPVYDCPDCTFSNITYPIGSQWWDDPLRRCVRYRCSSQGLVEQVHTELPCADVRIGCVPIREEPACCHHKYNCMFDYEHNLIPMTYLPS